MQRSSCGCQQHASLHGLPGPEAVAAAAACGMFVADVLPAGGTCCSSGCLTCGTTCGCDGSCWSSCCWPSPPAAAAAAAGAPDGLPPPSELVSREPPLLLLSSSAARTSPQPTGTIAAAAPGEAAALLLCSSPSVAALVGCSAGSSGSDAALCCRSLTHTTGCGSGGRSDRGRQTDSGLCSASQWLLLMSRPSQRCFDVPQRGSSLRRKVRGCSACVAQGVC